MSPFLPYNVIYKVTMSFNSLLQVYLCSRGLLLISSCLPLGGLFISLKSHNSYSKIKRFPHSPRQELLSKHPQGYGNHNLLV